jgi:serine/threonine-protein kinase
MSSASPPGNRSGDPGSAEPLSEWIKSHETAQSPSTGSSPRPALDELRLAPGTLLAGRYRIVAPLGRGGMGEVYRAEDVKLGQAVALKFLRGAVEEDPALLERLLAEVRVGREISHPNVCRLYDVVEVDGRHFIAMEYVDGENLASLLSRIGRLPSDKTLELARDLCAGLAAMHDKGVVHRDLKPANVMIDGRGRARITDFGLAVSRDAAQREAFAGTPAYMSPEQLAGGEATPRSDLYSLGLVLYEMSTGQPFFDARTLADLLTQHREAKASRLAPLPRPSHAERFVSQCLQEDPLARPASVRALAALLPGGDPLDALIAAGETPSPEMLAAAGRVGDLAALPAWIALVATLTALGVAAFVADSGTLLGQAPPPKPPEVLLERSRQVLGRLGYATEGADSAHAFGWDRGFVAHRVERLPPRERWQGLAQARPGPWYFYYRTSPRRLVAANRDAAVRLDDPPLDVSGMTRVVLDVDGRLTGFTAVPPQLDDAARGEPDWQPLLEEAGGFGDTLEAAQPRWAAPVDSDRKAAWEAVLPDGTPVRLEAAAYHGRVVWFELQPPWRQPDSSSSSEQLRVPVRTAGLVVIALAIPIGGVLLARHNIRLGRGDRKGAFAAALVVFVAYSAARLFQADHVASFGQELWLLVKVLAYPAFWAALVWILYMALEPYARRRWPHMLVSWKRLVEGRFRDPLVGRDVLLGCLMGVGTFTAYALALVMPRFFGAYLSLPDANLTVGPTITEMRLALFRLLVNAHGAVLFALVFLFLLVLLRMLLRNGFLAALVWALIVAGPIPGDNPAFGWIAGVVRGTVCFIALTRGGLLRLVALLFCLFNLVEAPLTLHFGAWYASRSLPVLLAIAGLAVYGFRVSLAGKPAFGRLLED